MPTTLQLLRPIAEALDAAHAANVVHRDLKPQNIFLTWDSNGETIPKLLDFGMAKLLGDSPIQTLSGTPMGTPLYMSPEQARGDKVDGRSDVYALGVLAHELLTGRLPITGDSTIVVLMAHILQPPPRMSEVCADLPPAMDEPILRMLDKDPGARPARAGAALADLLAAAERSGIVVPSGMPHLRRPAPAPASLDSQEIGNAPTESAAEDVTRASRPDTAASSTPAIRRGSNMSWPIVGALVALALVAAYFVGGKMTASNLVKRSVNAEAPSQAQAQANLPPRILSSPAPAARAASPAPAVPAAPPTAAGPEPTTPNVVPDRPRPVPVKPKQRAAGLTPRASIPSDLESPF